MKLHRALGLIDKAVDDHIHHRYSVEANLYDRAGARYPEAVRASQARANLRTALERVRATAQLFHAAVELAIEQPWIANYPEGQALITALQALGWGKRS